jgi:hypothetical protein
LRNRINTLFATAVLVASASGVALSYAPTVAQLDAEARAVGNRRDLAQHIGDVIFATRWPAEVTQISANALDAHVIVGIRVLGIKFHATLTRESFVDEVVSLVDEAFAAAPEAEEVDLWASVPISVAKGVVVSGDLAKPTSRTVFGLSVRRGESAASIRARIQGAGGGAFWDQTWTRTAFSDHV